jgi:hypothetical protein
MAIFFDRGLDQLKADLGNGGYDVLGTYRFPKVPGRMIQLFLSNAVFVSWDRQSRRLHIDGPAAQQARVKEFLRLTYEASWLEKTWVFHRRMFSLATVAFVLLAGGILLSTTLHPGRTAVANRARSSFTSSE